MTQSLNSAPQKQKFSVAINSKMYQNLIASTLRDPARARRFTAAITSAVAVNPALQECDAGTILAGALLGESLNLSPSPQLGQYYLVPFKQKAKYDRGGNMIRPETTTATFVLGYKGYIQLALRSGQYKDLDVMVIKQGEYMGKDPETGKAKFQFIEDDDERETLPAIGYMAYFRNTDGYTVIIGHRRLAAAKAAGLMELPCIVVEDMTLEEQISTMMTENMQRSDLTVYEEAEGFQMMMDFGNSVEQVADKAGFSESTIRRRVKLLSLDREAFKKSVKRGATLADFALLDKLDTEEAKNEVLKSVGTNNFRACLDRALREQKDRKTMNAIREVVASYATKADSKAAMPENCLFYASYGSWSGTVEAPADAGEHAYWYTESGYGITVYRERTEEDEPAEKTPEQLAREAKIEEYREKCRVIEEDEESAYRLRLNYLKEYGFPKKAAETVALAACRMMILNPDALGDMDEDTIEAVYGDGIYNDEHEVYPVRPLICRAFICSRTLQAARKTRDLVQSDRDIHSLRWEIFKNPESIALIQAAQRAATKK